MPLFTVTVKRITDNNSPQIKELIALDKLKGKARLPYEPLPNDEHTFPVECADRREAYKAGSRYNGLRFTGQLREIWVNGAQAFGNY